MYNAQMTKCYRNAHQSRSIRRFYTHKIPGGGGYPLRYLTTPPPVFDDPPPPVHHCEKVFHKAVHATFSPEYPHVTSDGKIEVPPPAIAMLEIERFSANQKILETPPPPPR